MMRILISLLLWMQLPMPAQAELVLVPRSALGAYMIGQQMGDGVSQLAGGVMDLQRYSGDSLAGYAQLDAWRKELESCGNCAERASLLARMRQLQAHLIGENGPLCTTIDVMKESPITKDASALTAIGNVGGVSQVCERYKRELEINEMQEATKKARQDFDRKIKAGDLSAYAAMGDWIGVAFEKSRVMSDEDRRYFSCWYFFEGARKGDVGSLVSLSGKCTLDRQEHQEVARMLVACVQKAATDDRCADTLDTFARAYASARPARLRYPVDADDKEALRLREEVLRHWERRAAAHPQDARVQASLASARQQVQALKSDRAPAPAAGTPERAEIHAFMRQWCTGIAERAGRSDMLVYDCSCFVRETDRHITEGRIVWARTQREGIFDMDLVDACVDRAATASAWVGQLANSSPAAAAGQDYLACAHRAIAQDIPLDRLKQRYAAGWKGFVDPLCNAATPAATRAGPAASRSLQSPPGQSATGRMRQALPEVAAAQPRTQRIDPAQRRCEILLHSVQRMEEASAAQSARRAGRLESARAQYQRSCGG